MKLLTKFQARIQKIEKNPQKCTVSYVKLTFSILPLDCTQSVPRVTKISHALKTLIKNYLNKIDQTNFYSFKCEWTHCELELLKVSGKVNH